MLKQRREILKIENPPVFEVFQDRDAGFSRKSRVSPGIMFRGMRFKDQ